MNEQTEIRVRSYHIDLYKHVNHARYLEFLEEARWRYFEQQPALFDYAEQHNMGFVIVNVNINYKYPATAGETLLISTELSTVNRKSMVIDQSIFLKGSTTPVADAKITAVLMNLNNGKAVEINDEIKALF